ncbi:MAG: MFS transporter, partial [Cyanobacteria bacterium P01_H01_bin.150]
TRALQAAGFQEKLPGQTELPIQPDTALTAIRFAVGPIPIACLICGLLLTYFYPITREMHAEIMLKLEERGKKEQ